MVEFMIFINLQYTNGSFIVDTDDFGEVIDMIFSQTICNHEIK